MLFDDRLVCSDSGTSQSWTDHLLLLDSVTGLCLCGEDALGPATPVATKVIELVLLDGLVEAIDGLEII
jgi:hypothetical protein